MQVPAGQLMIAYLPQALMGYLNSLVLIPSKMDLLPLPSLTKMIPLAKQVCLLFLHPHAPLIAPHLILHCCQLKLVIPTLKVFQILPYILMEMVAIA